MPDGDDIDCYMTVPENPPQENALLESEKALMRKIEQLRDSLKQKDDCIRYLTIVVNRQEGQINDLNDLREEVSDLRGSNLEIAARLEEVSKALVKEQLERYILEGRFDSIIGQGVLEIHYIDGGSQLSGLVSVDHSTPHLLHCDDNMTL